MQHKLLKQGATIALIGAILLLGIRLSRTEQVQEATTSPVFAEQQEDEEVTKPTPKVAEKALEPATELTWQDNPNKCTDKQWIAKEKPFNCIDKPQKPVEAVASEPSTPVAQPPTVVASGSVESIVRSAAIKHGLDPDWFVRLAMCESGLNPNAVNYNYYENGNPSGLFQHISGYWGARASQYGYAGASVFNAEANANVTAAMWATGSHLWECQ